MREVEDIVNMEMFGKCKVTTQLQFPGSRELKQIWVNSHSQMPHQVSYLKIHTYLSPYALSSIIRLLVISVS